MTPTRAASSTPRRGVHCRVGTMPPVPWSAVAVTTESARMPKSANIAVGRPPSQAVASAGEARGAVAHVDADEGADADHGDGGHEGEDPAGADAPDPAPLGAAGAGEDGAGAHRAAPFVTGLGGVAVVVDAALGEREVGVLEGLLDLGEVVHGYADLVGEVADLAGGQPGDLELAGSGVLHVGARSARARCSSSGCGVRTRTRWPPRPRSTSVDVGVGDEPPRPMITTRSAISCISLIRWLETRTVRPSSAKPAAAPGSSARRRGRGR